MNTTLADSLIEFYRNLEFREPLPDGIGIMYPHADKKVMEIVTTFFKKYYSDQLQRRLIFGINPGRFGAGITGINFTGPRQLTNYCGIEHPFGNSSELSAEFIYEVIERYGGPSDFYKKFFISAMSPLGFVKDGVNMNYYDDKKFQEAVTPFIIENIEKLIGYGFKRDRCICIGGGKNLQFFNRLNEKHHFFNEIVPLPHPRFILQYRRKYKEDHIREYLGILDSFNN